MDSSRLILVLILSYLLGAIPFAVLVGKRVRGVDIQRTGSGNAGAMNTFRSVGRMAGVMVALLDLAKAGLAMLLARQVLGPEAAPLCGAAAVAGHCFSPYLLFATRGERGGGWKMALRRSGGKGLASGMGALLFIDWRLVLAATVMFLLSLLILRKDETWPTIITVVLTLPLVWWFTRNWSTTIAVLLVSIIVIVKHLPDARTGFNVTMTKNQ